MSRACRVVANVAACLARELTGEALLQKSHLAQVGSIWFVLVRVGSCDFVDRPSFLDERNDPRNHTN